MCIRDSVEGQQLRSQRSRQGQGTHPREIAHAHLRGEGQRASAPPGVAAQVQRDGREAVGPVSYTHLDVYKRQGHQQAEPDHENLSQMLFDFFHDGLPLNAF